MRTEYYGLRFQARFGFAGLVLLGGKARLPNYYSMRH